MTEPKAILVTGASRGIGFLSAKALALAGHRVFAGLRDIDNRNAPVRAALLDWAKDKRVSLEPIALDVTEDASVSRAANMIEDRVSLDVLINNAGVMPVGVTEAYSPDQVRACLEVNLIGAIRTSRAVLPAMRRRRSGLLIHVSSTAGRLAIPFFGLYCASKWALEAYAESLHYELATFGVESVLVEPGPHQTDLVKAPPAPADEKRVAGYGRIADGSARMLSMFEAKFAAGKAITDAQNVAEAICTLVAMEQQRPLRTTVGDDMGLRRINERTAPLQEDLVEAIRPCWSQEAFGAPLLQPA